MLYFNNSGTMAKRARDPATFSNYEEITATNYDLNWNVDFNSKKISGSVTISLTVLETTDKLVRTRSTFAIFHGSRFWMGVT